ATRSHRAPPSFPTRRSSDLLSNPHGVILPSEQWRRRAAYPTGDRCPRSVHLAGLLRLERVDQPLEGRQGGGDRAGVLVRELVERSEEHTSELQSRFDLVCRL